MEKPEEEKLADELFGVVAREISKMMFRVDECGGISMSSLVLKMMYWHWDSKKNFLLEEGSDTYLSFAKAVGDNYRELSERLKSMIDVMRGSSTLEEMKLKFALAGLLGENSPADGA